MLNGMTRRLDGDRCEANLHTSCGILLVTEPSTINDGHRSEHSEGPLEHMVCRFRGTTRVLWLALSFLLSVFSPARAETVAPSVHWGAIDYPDRDRTLIAGLTVNRFTEFNGSGARFNPINQTAGFNFATVSWTERMPAFPGWTTNLTIGAGPTGEEPSMYLQNGFLHRLLETNPVPVDQKRVGGDVMAGGSLTRWARLFSERDTGFVSLGVAGGSLYEEVYGRLGLRQISLAELVASMNQGVAPAILTNLSRFVRFSAMGRYSRVYGGSAYPSTVIANQSYLAQGSVSIADYEAHDGKPPRWELEFAATIDSGLFVSPSGHGIERRFGAIAVHFPYGVFETWNDVLGRTDSGPTYGFRLMVDVLQLQSLVASP